MNRAVNALLFIGGVAFGTIFSAIIVSAWTGPTSAAPNSNVSAPINVGTTDQIKNGGLGINSLAVFGNTILSGTNSYLNFGATAGTNGYGIRDNSGTLEFKNTGGSWNNFTNSVLNILGAGAVTLIKYADGSTQTTAVPTGTWCGMHTVPSFNGSDANYPDVWVNGAYVNANIKCEGLDPATSCPAGYTKLQWAFTGWNNVKSQASAISTCVKN